MYYYTFACWNTGVPTEKNMQTNINPCLEFIICLANVWINSRDIEFNIHMPMVYFLKKDVCALYIHIYQESAHQGRASAYVNPVTETKGKSYVKGYNSGYCIITASQKIIKRKCRDWNGEIYAKSKATVPCYCNKF